MLKLTRYADRPKGQSAAAWAALAESVIDSYAKMLSDGRRVTCVYCGHQYPDGTPESQNAALTAHICECQAHPMRKIGEALCGVMGLSFPPSSADLDGMCGGIKEMASMAPDQSTVGASLAAVESLRVFAPNPQVDLAGSPASPCWADSDELDYIIAVKIMGWKVHPRNTAHWMKATDNQIDYRPVAYTCGSDRWSPTRNLLDAWRVVERITTPCVGSVNGIPWATRFAYLFRDADLWAYNREEAARDICQLAIRAAGIELPPNPQVDLAGASPAQVQRVVGRQSEDV